MAEGEGGVHSGPIRPGYVIYPIPHIDHRHHLCDLAERGQISLEQMKALVRDPKFICKKCGRVSAKSENLCEPVSMDFELTVRLRNQRQKEIEEGRNLRNNQKEELRSSPRRPTGRTDG